MNPLSDGKHKYLSALANPQNIWRNWSKTKDYSVSLWLRTYCQVGEAVSNAFQRAGLPKKLSIAVYNYYAFIGVPFPCRTSWNDMEWEDESEIHKLSWVGAAFSTGRFKEDLVLCNLNLDDNAPSSSFLLIGRWPCIAFRAQGRDEQWLAQAALESAQSNGWITGLLGWAGACASTLISDYWLVPMFHHLQTVRFKGFLKM